ncbi:MAG: dihydroorotase [Phycisphaerales bacterium]|nr:dihydroorotase [Phycisphaerales bacterium]
MPESRTNPPAIVLRGGRVLDPGSGLDATADVRVDNGRITAINTNPGRIDCADARVIDVEGLLVCPGLVDPHVHLREPGGERKETIATGTRAAIAGGFTTVCCMPNTVPAIDSPTTLDFVRLRAEETGHCRVFVVAAATEQRAGEALAPIQAMARAGAVGFSDDGAGIACTDMMHKVLKTCQGVDRCFMQHCQDPSLTVEASMHEGAVSARLGLVGWPRVAEEVMLERDLRLNRDIGCRYHAQHLSSGNSVEILRAAREAGVPASGEVSPHHLLLTDEACDGWNTNAKMNPPLRESSDVKALIAGVADGVITVLGTDHAPHTEAEKKTAFEHAAWGIIGVESALPLYAEALVRSGAIDWPRMIGMMTIEPARLCGLDARGIGSLAVDGPGDITVIDPEQSWKIDIEEFESKARNCPFHDREVKGRAVMTILNGEIRCDLLALAPSC